MYSGKSVLLLKQTSNAVQDNISEICVLFKISSQKIGYILVTLVEYMLISLLLLQIKLVIIKTINW